MSNTKISQLSSAAALDGTEEVPIVQSGETVKTTTQDIADLGGGGSLGYSVYVTSLSQANSTAAPTSSDSQNTIGFDSWIREGVGAYATTGSMNPFDFSKIWVNGVFFNSTFHSEKIPISIWGGIDKGYYILSFIDNTDGTFVLTIQLFDDGGSSVDLFDINFPLFKLPEIRVYT